MSKPLTFMRKLKLFRLYLKTQQNGVIVDCAFCGSTNINFEIQKENEVVSPQIDNNGFNQGVVHSTLYQSIYKCNNCGAECMNTQEWSKDSSSKTIQ